MRQLDFDEGGCGVLLTSLLIGLTPDFTNLNAKAMTIT